LAEFKSIIFYKAEERIGIKYIKKGEHQIDEGRQAVVRNKYGVQNTVGK